MRWFRKTEEWEEWEIQGEEYYQEGHYENNHQEWEEEVETKRGITPFEFWLFIGLFLYWCFLMIGFFSTDFHNGKGYVVDASLREERAYIENITPFYDVLIRTPDAVIHLENEYPNTIDYTYHLSQLQQTILTMQQQEKTNQAPPVYQSFQQYLLQLADQSVAYVQLIQEYIQDPTDAYRDEILEREQDLQHRIENIQQQMKEIEERLIRNQQE